MKIHDFNGGNRHVSANRQNPSPSGVNHGFRNVMEQLNNKTQNPGSQITAGGLKGLFKDSLSLTAGEIKKEIDAVCDCETGECIDITRLNELLKLYGEVSK